MQKNLNNFFTKLATIIFLLISNAAFNQSKSVITDLSKSATKGLLDDVVLENNGNIRVTYKMKVDKKSDEAKFEDYVFDNNLNFKGIEPYKVPNEPKVVKPDYNLTSLAAYVGGSNSFNVLSMTLKFEKEVWERKWNTKNQKYDWGKRLSKETVKMKDSDGKYRGFANYPNDDDGSQFVFASLESKSDDDAFVALYATNDMNIKETKLTLSGSYSLAFCGQLKNTNVFAIFAPNKGNSNSKYVFYEFTNKAELVASYEFSTPSPNLAITDFFEEKGNIYLLGGSTKDNDPYNKVFTSYAPIDNPGYSTSKNAQMFKYEKSIRNNDFDNFHFIKLSNQSIGFISSIPVKLLKSKIKTPPAFKKGVAFNGNKFMFQNYVITPNNEFLITGQLYEAKIENGGTSIANKYAEVVCLHLNSNGELITQYCVDKVNDDSKSEYFRNKQNFILSSDGNTMYWEILEVKGTKSYDSWIDAYLGNKSLTGNLFPRIGKIDLKNASLSDFENFGNDGKYLLYKYNTSIISPDKKTYYYFGHDEDYEKLWVSKYQFN
ncbi:MAG: hypothetical protein KGZ59_04960 [Chitinophagaceae bacterium]|nr:hypothetical protein [Chitinophagaceae bacterium]